MLKVYFSHRITGGLEDPVEAFAFNCKIAQEIAAQIQKAIPSIEMYVPGGPTEEFVGKAYLKKFMTVEQIMEIDCDILATKDIVLCYVPKGDTLQGGRLQEVEYAEKIGKPFFVFSKVDQAIAVLIDYMVGHN